MTVSDELAREGAVTAINNPTDGDGLQRVPPQSIEAEVCVLGAMVLHAPTIDILVEILRPEHFYRPAHQQIYQVLVDMHDQRKPIDLVTVREELERQNLLEQVGGIEYVADMVAGVPDAGNADYYAGIVRDKALLRELIVAGTEMVREAYDTNEQAADVVDRAESHVFQIAQEHVGQQAVDLKTLLQGAFEALNEQEGRLITGLASGYDQLDELTSGFQNGEMVILASRPSMGKTSIMLNIAEHMAATDGEPVAIFSMEMSKEQLTQRFLASHAQFNLRLMRRGSISAEAWTLLQNAADTLQRAPIYVDDSPTLTPLQLRAKARRLVAAHGIKCVFIDYLQLMTANMRPAASRYEQITDISRSIKALARELKIPVVCAAQLNRGPADRPSHRPRMSDLRDSGSIEQDADVIALLHREDYYHLGEENYMPTELTELIVAKQRNGPTGVVNLRFHAGFTRFESASLDSYVATDNVPV